MLSKIYKLSQGKIQSYVNYSSTLKYHCSCVMYGPSHYSKKYTDDEELKILNTINSCTKEDFVKYDINERQVEKILTYREQNGNFKTFDDIIITQDVTPLIKLCKSILTDGKPQQRVKTTKAPKSLITPVIDEYSKQNIHRTLALHVWSNEIYWAMIDENKNLSHWDFAKFKNPSKVSVVPFINAITKIVLELPYADAYVMESDQHTSLSKLKCGAFAVYLQRQLAITAIISALGLRHQDECNNIKGIKNFYTLQSRTSARQYHLNLGSETISSASVVADILAGSHNSDGESLISIEPHIEKKYTSTLLATREHLRIVLLVALTFIDLLNNRKINH